MAWRIIFIFLFFLFYCFEQIFLCFCLNIAVCRNLFVSVSSNTGFFFANLVFSFTVWCTSLNMDEVLLISVLWLQTCQQKKKEKTEWMKFFGTKIDQNDIIQSVVDGKTTPCVIRKKKTPLRINKKIRVFFRDFLAEQSVWQGNRLFCINVTHCQSEFHCPHLSVLASHS